jgi:hypothetical protein
MAESAEGNSRRTTLRPPLPLSGKTMRVQLARRFFSFFLLSLRLRVSAVNSLQSPLLFLSESDITETDNETRD